MIRFRQIKHYLVPNALRCSKIKKFYRIFETTFVFFPESELKSIYRNRI